MKKLLLSFLFFFSLFLTSSSFVMHEYYVSITNVFINDKSHQLEIEIKIDAEDFEKVLKIKNESINIDKITDRTILDIKHYINNNFEVWLNGSKKQLEIIGTELKEDGIFYCYLLVSTPNVLNSIKISNKLLLPTFLQQHNIVNIEVNHKTLSHTFIHQHTLHTFKLDAK